MKEYIHSLGLLLEDIHVDRKGRLFILIEGKDLNGNFCYKEIEIPEEYQTFENIEIIKNLKNTKSWK